MHKFLLRSRLSRWLAVAVLALLAAPGAQAQLSGAKAIPGDYASVAAAITALNAGGVGAGGVTFNIAAGYTETFASPTAGAITATGTVGNLIVFQKAGSGANPKITAGVGTSTTLDAIISLAGSDYVTFDGLDLAENTANTTPTTQAEFGYALARASATDGAQFNIIRNCVVTLNKTNTGTIGIAGLASTAASATALPATSTAGANSGNKLYGNVVTNSLIGIYLAAASTTTIANYDQNNEIGVTAGNTVGNFGGAASGYGAGGTYQNGLKVAGNTVNSTLNYTSATTSTAVAASTVTSTLRGIYTPTGVSSNVDITNNTVTLASGATTSQLSGIENGMGSTAASNTVNITGNTLSMSYLTATSATVYGYYNTGSAATVNLTGNTLNATTLATTGSTYLINNNQSGTTVTVANNQLSGVMRTGVSGSLYGYYNNGSGAGTQSLTGNVFNNITVAGASLFYGLYSTSSASETQLWSANQITNITAGATPTGALYGIYDTYGNTGSQFFNNTVSGLNGGSTVYGIFLSNSGLATAAAFGNTVNGLISSGASSTVYGIYTSSVTTPTVYRNKVYDLSASGATATVYGLYNTGGTTITYHNNLVGDLRTPASGALVAVVGLYISSGTTVNAYYNTINLNASSTGATFGTAGIYFTPTPTTVDLRNNVVVNKSTAVGTGGSTSALRRSTGTAGTAPANLATTTNNNLYYAGTPSATNLIYVEGTTATVTNAQQTLAGYKALVAARESSSVTEDVPFLSTTGSAATFLHINPAVATQVESGGTPVAGITTDFDGDTRNATTPDIGADEGTFLPQDLSGPTITVPALANSPSTTSRTITVTITDASGVATGTNAPRLFFRKGSSGAFQSVGASGVSGSSYTFTFDYALVGGVVPGDAIQYYVVAQDVPGNVSSNPPGGTFTTPPSQVYQFLIQTQLSGIYYVGTGTSPNPARTFATLTAATTAYNQNQLTGAVTFVLLDASYGPSETFPIQLLNNADASATNTLTIKPNTGLSTALTGSNTSALFQLIGSDYVTLDGSNGGTISATDPRPSRNWTINNTNAATTSNGIVLTVFNSGTDAATNNTFKNLVITGNGSATTQSGIIMLATATATTANNNNKVLNNAISGSVYGIYSSGPSATLKNTGTVISQNDMTATGALAIGRFGITALFENGIQLVQNTIDGINFAGTGDVWGISAGFTGISTSTFTGSEVTNATINRNYVGLVKQSGTYSATGIALAAATAGTTVISNNMVAGVSSNGTSGDFGAGIFIGGGAGSTTRLLYNSVSMTGTQTGGNYPGFALAIGGTTPTVEIRNNILLNTQTTGSGNSIALGLAYSSTTGAYVGLTSDHNDFFVGTGTTFAVGQTGSLTTSGVLRPTLAALNTETGQDNPATSKSVNPQFVSATDLHVTASALNNAGVPVSGVTDDFDGETRSATTPDIGADEFTPAVIDIAATALLNPLAAGCYGAAETVAVSITNNSTTPISFATNPTTVTVTVTKPDNSTQLFTTTVSTGTLAGGATQTVTLPGTLNLTAGGTYSFAVTTTTTGDGTPGNDNLTATRTVIAVAAQPQLVTFTGFTGSNLGTVFPGWSEATGPTVPTGTTSAWTNQTGFGGTGNITAKVNLFTTGKAEWIVSPKLLATSSTVLTFDAGLTDFASTAADAAGMTGTDDFVEVRISTDCGQTFARIPAFAQFNANNQPPNGSLRNYAIDLSAYAGQQFILGFFASEGTVDDVPDYDFHLDNISVRSPLPIDLAPLALVTPTATQGCYSAAETVSVSIINQGSQTLDFAANPATVTATVTTPTGSQTLTGTVTSGTLAAGASQTVTLAPTLDMTAVGTYSFAITATVTGDQTTSNDALAAVTRTVAAPVAGTLAPANSTICVSGTAALTLTGAANGTIQYQSSSDNVTFADVAGATSATYTTPVLTSTTYYRAQVRCGTAVATSNVSTLTVNNPLVASTNTPVSICAGSTATLTATASAGASVRFFDVATGGTALATTTAGSYTTPALTASATYYAEAFTGGTETVGKPTSRQTDGGYSGSDTGLVFTTTGGLTLQSTTVYNATATAGSVSVELRSSTGTLIATAGPFAVAAGSTTALVPTVLPLNLTVPAAGTYRLVTASTPTPPTLYRDGSSGNAFPYTSASGAISITSGYISGTSASYYFFYNILVGTECAGATRTAIQVNVTAPATASFATATGSSCGISAYQLAGSVGGSATGGTYTSSGTGTFSPNASTLTATYTPSAADVAAGSVTITLTSAGSTPCPAATATFALSISPAPVATFSYPTATTYCAGSASTVTPTLGSGATAGTFSSTTGLTIDATTGVITLGSSTAGTYTVTNSVAASGACAAVSATATVTITPATTATFSYGGGTFCVSGANPTATVTGTAGGTFSSTAGLTISASTGAITLSSTTPGTYTVTYTVAGACGSSSTQSVTITTAPLATFSYGPAASTYCVSGATNPAPSFGTGASAGVFSSTTGLTVNATTGVITLASSTPGTYTVTNTIAANGGCAAASATAQVTITAAPVATFSYGTTSTFCVSGTTNPAVTLGTGATAGTFSSTTGLTINASTGAITLSSSTPGTYTVTNSVAAANGCAATTATATVTITAAPVATFSYGTPSTFCVSGTTAPAVTLGTGATAGTFSSTTGLTLNATTGAITLASSTPGTYTVTNSVAAANGCAATTATATVTITAAPVATFSYATATGCVGSASTTAPTLGTGASAGTFSSTTGLTINATTGVITLSSSTAGTYTVTNTVAAAGGCAAATATTTFTVNPRPATPTIGVVYNGGTTTLTSSAATGNQFYFNNVLIAGATGQTYVVNGTPASLGSYTVTTTNANGCTSLPSLPLVVTGAKTGLTGASLKLYPNPTPSGQVTLELTGYRSATQLTVLDALGRVVTQQLLPANTGTATHTLDLTGAATGVYLLRLSNADGVETRRLVRE
ncbi:MAG: T9SS type A sorting domain-containing protein [Bacteroidota bacterium]|nr:T9SS type A sorting domain-containing protein [Bacteroidota bacterium]